MKKIHFSFCMLLLMALTACMPALPSPTPTTRASATPFPTLTATPSASLRTSPPPRLILAMPQAADLLMQLARANGEMAAAPGAGGINFTEAAQAGPDYMVDYAGVAAVISQNEYTGIKQAAIHTGRYADWFSKETANGGIFTAGEEIAYLKAFQQELDIQAVHSQTPDGLISSFVWFADPDTHDAVMLWPVNDDNLLMSQRPDVPGAPAFHFAELRLPDGFDFRAVDHAVFVVDADSGVPVAWVDPAAGQDDGEGRIVKALKVILNNGTAVNLMVERQGADLAVLNPDGKVMASINSQSNGWGEQEITVPPEVIDYGICPPENFRNCPVPAEDLFNGNYLRFLESLSVPFNPEKFIKTVPMSILWYNAIGYPEETAPNFEGVETTGLASQTDFRKGRTSGYTEINGFKYRLIPTEYYDKDNPDHNVWVIALGRIFHPDDPNWEVSEEHTNRFIKLWEEMKYTPLVRQVVPPDYSTPDILATRTFDLNGDGFASQEEEEAMQELMDEFMAGNTRVLHGKVFLTEFYSSLNYEVLDEYK